MTHYTNQELIDELSRRLLATNPPEKPKVGDLVMWESGSVIMWEAPRLLLKIEPHVIYPGKTHFYAFVAGSPTGYPIDQLSKA